jgi:CTP:molybdopterin cytidylyltransferase MocA
MAAQPRLRARRDASILRRVSEQRARAAIGGMVLAAGAARRFGSPKQLATLNGRPLLEHALAAMAAAARIGPTVVVLGSNADEIVGRVDLHGARAVICADWEEGQSASLRAGVAALQDGVEAIVVTLGDQPAIDARAIDRVAGARAPAVVAVRATYGGRPGHPVLLEHDILAAVASLRGDDGARNLLAGLAVALVDCDGLGNDLDVDTVEQLRLSADGSSSPS